MPQPLNVLIVDGSENKAQALLHYLRAGGFDPAHRRVETRETLATALRGESWDVVLCGHRMPALSALMALKLIQRADPDVPVIVVAGAMRTEVLIRLLKSGASDAVLKDNLHRLKPAIERALAEAETRRRRKDAEMRLIGAIESISEGIALFDSDDRLVMCNERYREILWRCRSEIFPGMTFEEIVRAAAERGQYPVERNELDKLVADRLAKHRKCAEPFEQEFADDQWVRIQERRTLDGGIVVVLTDITERKRREATLQARTNELARSNARLKAEIAKREATEASLRESASRTRAIFDNAGDGIITFDDEGIIESVNPAAQRIFAYRADDLSGRRIAMLLPARGGDAASHGPALLLKESVVPTEFAGRRSDGNSIPVEVTVGEVPLEKGRIFSAVVRDITERKKLEQMKNQFISVVGHELRTPLTSIKGSLGLLGGQVGVRLPKKARAMIDIAFNNSERLVRLINDILDVEKIESGKLQFDFEAAVLAPILERAVEDNRGYAAQLGVNIELGKVTDDIMVMADPERLKQVLANLISNGAKFSPEGGTVTVSAERKEGSVRICVQDRGPGIPEDFRDRVFEKFAQDDASDSRKRGGTGLGLSIAKAIVERHGGYMAFKTAAGKGATFYFELPAFRRSRAGATRRPPSARPCVLVCSPAEKLRASLTRMIGEIGYDVMVCASADAAGTLLGRGGFAAMVLDPAQPHDEGIGLIRRLRADDATRQLPIIVVSARPRGRKLEGGALNLIDWLEKPLDRERLREHIKSAVDGAGRSRPRLLHVEDDDDHRAIVAQLIGDLADVDPAASREQARRLLASRTYDLVLLDLLLPDAAGESLLPLVCDGRRVAPPVLVLSVKDVPASLTCHLAGALVKSRVGNDRLKHQIQVLLDGGRVTRDMRLFA